MSSDLSALMGIIVACLVEYAVGTEGTSPEKSSKIRKVIFRWGQATHCRLQEDAQRPLRSGMVNV